jgi:hypothetical protein
MSTRHLRLALRGLVAVHAARATHTALGAVSGIQSATVSMAGAEIDFAGPYDAEVVATAIRAALEPIGVHLEGVTVVQERMLPLA